MLNSDSENVGTYLLFNEMKKSANFAVSVKCTKSIWVEYRKINTPRGPLGWVPRVPRVLEIRGLAHYTNTNSNSSVTHGKGTVSINYRVDQQCCLGGNG